MRNLKTPAILLLAIGLLAGCTDNNAEPTPPPIAIPTVSETPTPTPTPTNTPKAQETPTKAPTTEPDPTMEATLIPAKSIALTFDDGPGTYTDDILDVLIEEEVPATFFVLGSEITPKREASLKRANEEGMSIQSHTWSHPDLRHQTREGIERELNKTSDAIEEVTGEATTCYRPPYGSTSKQVRTVTKDLGYTEMKWNIDSQDWQRPGADGIFKNATLPAYDGEIPVLLMHDGGGNREQTLEALPKIIQHYKDEGYTFIEAC